MLRRCAQKLTIRRWRGDLYRSRRRSAVVLVGLAGMLAVLVAGCGSSGSSSGSSTTEGGGTAESGGTPESGGSSTPPSRTVNLGGPKPIKVGGEPLNMAFFQINSNTPYAAATIEGAEEEADELGESLTVFDANFEAVKQTQQMETALASGKYNAWMTLSISPQGCAIVKQAIAKGIPVSVVNQPICRPSTALGEEAYFPGTVNYVGGDQTAIIPEYLNKVVEENPGKQKMVLLTGPTGIGQTTIAEETVEELKANDPELEVVMGNVATYDLAGAKEQMESLLAANSDVSVVATLYSDLTQGAVLALEQAGVEGVKVYDSGGSKWAYQAVKDGTIEFTTPNLPKTQASSGIKSLYTTWVEGKPGPHYVNILEVAGFGKDIFITKENVGESEPEF